MTKLEYFTYECTEEAFRPQQRYQVRWLNWELDYELAETIWPPHNPLTLDVWETAKRDAYRYCAVIQHEQIASIAAMWQYSVKAWEVAAVATQPLYGQRGYGLAVVSFVTAAILQAKRRATCTTATTNTAMQRTVERVGFVLTMRSK